MFAKFICRQRRATLRQRLARLVLLTAALFVGVIMIVGLRDRADILQAELARVGDIAHMAALRQTVLIRQGKATLEILSHLPSVSAAVSGPAAECHRLLQEAKAGSTLIAALGVTTADGRITCFSDPDGPTRLPDVAFVRQVLGPGAPASLVSHLPANFLGPQPSILISTKLNGAAPEAASAGLLFAAINLAVFSGVLAALPASDRLRLGITDITDGTIVAMVPDPDRVTGRKPPHDPALSIIAANPGGGAARVRMQNGDDVLLAVMPLSGPDAPGLVVEIGDDYRSLLAAANGRLIRNLAGAAVALVLALVAAGLIVEYRLLRPLHAVGDVARRLGAGELAARVSAPGRLSSQFREVAKFLNVTGVRLMRSSITSQCALRRLANSEAEYCQLASTITDMLFRLDLQHRRAYVSPASAAMLGYSPEALIGTRPADTAHPDDAPALTRVFDSILSGQQERASITYRIMNRHGLPVWVETTASLLRDPITEAPAGIIGMVRDVSQRRAAAELIRQSEARYRLLADRIGDVVVHIGPDGRRRYVSPACLDVLGLTPEEMLSESVSDRVHPDDQQAVRGAMSRLLAGGGAEAVRLRRFRKDGSVVWVEALARPMPDGEGYALSMRDISHRVEIEAQLETANRRLEMMASQDGLTGLANRRRFDEALDGEVGRAARDGTQLSLIMIDVDYFKRYNDRYGHMAGDGCLRDVATAVQACVRRPADLAARYGGEEVAVLLPNTTSAGAMRVAGRIRRAVRHLQRAHLASPLGVVTVSAGTATLDPRCTNPVSDCGAGEHLVQFADTALYWAKAAGRDCARVAMPGLARNPLRVADLLLQ